MKLEVKDKEYAVFLTEEEMQDLKYLSENCTVYGSKNLLDWSRTKRSCALLSEIVTVN